jgi:hypothetical protein
MVASLPAPPVLGYSFTAFSTNNPTGQQPGVNLDAEFNRTNAAVAALIGFLQVSVNADGTLSAAAVETAYEAGTTNQYGTGVNVADAPSALSALLAQAWAEYMPDQLPASTLATTGITGDHYSSRYWANQAAQTVQALSAQVAQLSAAVLALLTSSGVQPDYAGLAAYLATLPTALPATSGILWNNGDSFALS